MLENRISNELRNFFNSSFSSDLDISKFSLAKTKKEFDGDFTFVVFQVLKFSKMKPVELAEMLGKHLVETLDFVESYNVVKGFLNIKIADNYWLDYILDFSEDKLETEAGSKDNILIEFSSPNTNKPLHLGHIRNNLLGVSISNILEYAGHKVTKVCLLNDRGIHICKTMLAWENWGDGITPETANKKGDHLIGDFYVKFENEYQKELKELQESGMTKAEAAENSTLMLSAKKMLKKWERGNKKVLETWKLLNSWVVSGFDATYEKLGVSFDTTYLESEIYLKGKEIIMRELSKGTVSIDENDAILIDLTDVGLDKKVLLRSDGTTVYITQDIGSAVERYNTYKFDKHYYVVGNEQIYHFKVLKEILKKFGYEWNDKIIHYTYGMVELPDGKMKSREGKVVDADDLIQEMVDTAQAKAEELGKLDKNASDYDDTIYKTAMGALKYFILKVDPKKNMLFNPQESIDFNGNTGPFVQYTYTRINSLLGKAVENKIDLNKKISTDIVLNNKEIELIRFVYDFKNLIMEAADNMSPAIITNYIYDLAKTFNSYYQEYSILKEEAEDLKIFRLILSQNVALVIKIGLKLLGIDVPNRM